MTSEIDRNKKWDLVRERLKAVDAHLEKSFMPDPGLLKSVYQRRAVQLAQRKTDDALSKTFPVLAFHLGQERYAIEVSELSEVFSYGNCTPVPGAPDGLLGVINLRGEIRAVADLARILGLQKAEPATAGYVLMLRRQDGVLGVKVDRIEQVLEIDPAVLSSGDATSSVIHSPFVKGLTADTLILIDVAAALSHLFHQPT
jgi:purine-binding chemotaxis protein CheW